MKYKEIPAFCINLDNRSDRWSKVKEQFDAIGWSVSRVSALTHKDCPKYRLTPGQAGCIESHKKIWNIVSKCNCEVVAVFEDDAVFPSDFDQIFPKAYQELPSDWKVWHLHSFGPRQMNSILQYGSCLTKLTKSGWGFHGYLIKVNFALQVLSLSSKFENLNIDALLTHGLIKSGIQPYGVLPELTLCFQRGEDTDIPETKQNKYWTNMRLRYTR
jgi:GR25 family glycosyltransferase involved in LPS biosynthesis